MNISIEILLLSISVLFFISILAGKVSDRFGVPTLLLFLVLGMSIGSDGLGIHFENAQIAQSVGTVALCIILFSGGMDTRLSEIRPVALQGLLLSTLGVALTMVITGVLIVWVADMSDKIAGISFVSALLLAATMSSTDSASVFSILRSKGLKLRNNLRPMLEFESGSNDPVAYIFTITLIGIALDGGKASFWLITGGILSQLIIGAILGIVLGKLAVYATNTLKVTNVSFYPFMILTFAIFIYSATYFLKGNGFLAVYIAGLYIGNSKFAHKRSVFSFFNGMAWLFQLIMFLTLGLLVNPHELVPIIVPGLVVSAIIIFISRPLSVFICLAPFRKMQFNDKVFVSWVGLRGAVPIIFAIMALASEVPDARIIFNIVFFCTLVSLIVQGTSLPMIARWLGLAENPSKEGNHSDFDSDFDLSDEIKSVTAEIAIAAELPDGHNRLMDLTLPEQTLVVMVRREGRYFVPTGQTALHKNDNLLVITNNHEALAETYKSLGVEILREPNQS